MASAGCPTCHITVVQIPMSLLKLLEAATLQLPGALADDFGTAVKEAATLGAKSVSMSYGLPPGLQASYIGAGAPAIALHHKEWPWWRPPVTVDMPATHRSGRSSCHG
ncbi:hypothetical protein [Fodinicola feengrottensis]|uniref:hypothetical protein n=1 Tax=Fodinicola feengrottensis TaxID=435914 RepID=UPI00244266F6|nr:hypothetical protein [Fodinicola feengrottensis]